ncbi:MAG TPA: hypothetical protein PLO23_10070 [Alphaproteobacteria bacterium]|nr:hypothetical protein [Alphaproteobacteria bacterium]
MTGINGKVLRIETLRDLPRLSDVDVSAVVLDGALIPEFSAMRDFIAQGTRENPKKLTNTLQGLFWGVLFAPAELRAFRRSMATVFRSVSKNQTIREGWDIGGPKELPDVRHDTYRWGRFYSFKTMVANLGTEGVTGISGLSYLQTPVESERYKTGLILKAFDAARTHNPDLDWAELKPGEVLIYKGGEMAFDNSVQPYVHAQGPHMLFTMSDSETPLPPAH